MTITPLGSGQEVGRSCHLLTFRGTTILLDCGIHPGYDGMAGLPFFDSVDPESVDVLLVSHFHLDHAASLPYFTERTGFRGRIFMTHPTRAVIRLLLGDYLRLMAMKRVGGTGGDGGGGTADDGVLYTESELQSCVEKIELIDYHQTIELDLPSGLKFHALNAGHVLGAAMFHIELGGRTVLYTGDYSMEEDRHLMAAEIPDARSSSSMPDVLIVESTYGVQVHASRAERESRFTGAIERVVSGGGRCLIPVFALGRAQELLLILDEYWRDHPNLHSIPIYYASKMASRALRVYQTYANMMNSRIRDQMDLGNPFAFRHIRNLRGIDVNSFDDRGPSVVFASPGMLQSGVSRQLFDRWASDPKNGCIIAGYAVEHTLAKEIMSQPREVVTMEGRRQPLNCLVDYVSFSAHVDFVQNRDFITTVNPRNIILVHGAKEEMGRLKGALMMHYNKLPEVRKFRFVISLDCVNSVFRPSILRFADMRYGHRTSITLSPPLIIVVVAQLPPHPPQKKTEQAADHRHAPQRGGGEANLHAPSVCQDYGQIGRGANRRRPPPRRGRRRRPSRYGGERRGEREGPRRRAPRGRSRTWHTRHAAELVEDRRAGGSVDVHPPARWFGIVAPARAVRWQNRDA
jgi:cleavage and polyadenylation specificity factor subunit 3